LLLKFFNSFARSPKWGEVRKEHLKKQPYCQACGSTKKLEVHHIEPFHVNPAKELDPSNLITLCDKYCHYAIGHLMDYKSWNPNIVEDAKVYLDKVKNRPYKFEVYNDKKSFFNLWSYIISIFR
jgi:5-methylcytosine-specific restriction endonuclease McrA